MGIEYLAVEHRGRLLVTLSNFHHDAKRVRVLLGGQPVGGTDLRSGNKCGKTIELSSLEPVLLDVKR